MKKFPLILSLAATSSLPGEVIMLEDFEDSVVNYTSSISGSLADIASDDYFGRLSPGTALPNNDIEYFGLQGTGYFGVQDMDGALPVPTTSLTLSFEGIDISGYENLSFSGLIAEDDSSFGDEDWDASDSFTVAVSIDNGPPINVFAIESLEPGGDTTNTAPAIDTDFNGIGDGTEITDTFTQFDVSIPGTGNSLDLFLVFSSLNAADEDLAIDNITISGDFVIPEPSTALLSGLALLGLLRRRR